VDTSNVDVSDASIRRSVSFSSLAPLSVTFCGVVIVEFMVILY
jgi:hypothetical protein